MSDLTSKTSANTTADIRAISSCRLINSPPSQIAQFCSSPEPFSPHEIKSSRRSRIRSLTTEKSSHKSEGDVDMSSSCDDTSSRVESESSIVSKPKTSPFSSKLQKSSSPMMQNFLNYDPPSRTSDNTFYSSFTYLISRSAGLGFLCLPYAVKQVGVITGLALCFIAGLMFTHSFTTLSADSAVSELDRVQLGMWPDLQMVFNVFKLLAEMGFSVNYFNVSLSFDVVCLVFLLVPNGNYLTPLNFLINITCTGLLSLLFYNIFTSDMNISCQTLICGNWTDVFQYFGILLFAFIPIVQVFKTEDGSIRKNDFAWPKLLYTSMVIITNMYIAIGLCGYLDQQDVPIFRIPILEFMPAAIRCRTIVKTCVAVNVTIFHRELNVESTLLWVSSIKVDISDNKMGLPRSTGKYSPAMFAGLTAFTKILFTFCSFFVTIAVASPTTSGFHVMVALVGYLGNACNMMIYPYIVEMCVTYALHGISARRYVIFKDVCMVLLGLLVFACGTSALVMRIIHDGD